MARHTVLETRLGKLTVVREADALTGLYFPRHWPRPDRAAFGTADSHGFAAVARQLDEYLAGDRKVFDLPVEANGSDLDRRVWDLISQVPYGETTTYGDLSRQLNGEVNPQEVGATVGRNPLSILIPCHRVIGSTGKLTGYTGGVARKQALLELEQARIGQDVPLWPRL